MKKTITSLFIIFVFVQPVFAHSQEDCTKTENTKPETKNIETKSITLPIINEFIPDPEGSDDQEWIELKNPTDQEIILDGLFLDDDEGGSKPFSLDGKKILSESFITLYAKDTKLALNNASDAARLLKGTEIIEKISYEKTETGKSLARKNDNTWEQTDTLTPNAENIFPKEEIPQGDMSDEIEISEVLPNPSGSDKNNEWIELYNNSDENVNLSQWKISIKNKKYIIPENFMIGAKEYILLKFDDIGLTLKNSKNEIFLLDPENNEIDSVTYNDAPEDTSFSKITLYKFEEERLIPVAHGMETKKTWEWTDEITGGKANPEYFTFQGKIKASPVENKFQIKTPQGIFEIEFQEKTLNKNLAHIILKPGTKIEITAIKKSEKEFLLKTYDVMLSTEENITIKEKPWEIWWIFSMVLVICIAIYSVYRKRTREIAG